MVNDPFPISVESGNSNIIYYCDVCLKQSEINLRVPSSNCKNGTVEMSSCPFVRMDRMPQAHETAIFSQDVNYELSSLL